MKGRWTYRAESWIQEMTCKVRIQDKVYGWNEKMDAVVVIGEIDYLMPRIVQIPNLKKT